MILWTMVILQMLAWAYFSYKGGKITDRNFYIFTACMLLGQVATGIETYSQEAWRSFFIQAFFLSFTVFGGFQRFMNARGKPIKGN